MRYRVHQYVVVRVPVEIEADSIKAAIEKAEEQFEPSDAYLLGEYAGEITGYMVDPLLENGEVDIDNSVVCEYEDNHLIVNGEPWRE